MASSRALHRGSPHAGPSAARSRAHRTRPTLPTACGREPRETAKPRAHPASGRTRRPEPRPVPTSGPRAFGASHPCAIPQSESPSGDSGPASGGRRDSPGKSAGQGTDHSSVQTERPKVPGAGSRGRENSKERLPQLRSLPSAAAPLSLSSLRPLPPPPSGSSESLEEVPGLGGEPVWHLLAGADKPSGRALQATFGSPAALPGASHAAHSKCPVLCLFSPFPLTACVQGERRKGFCGQEAPGGTSASVGRSSVRCSGIRPPQGQERPLQTQIGSQKQALCPGSWSGNRTVGTLKAGCCFTDSEKVRKNKQGPQ